MKTLFKTILLFTIFIFSIGSLNIVNAKSAESSKSEELAAAIRSLGAISEEEIGNIIACIQSINISQQGEARIFRNLQKAKELIKEEKDLSKLPIRYKSKLKTVAKNMAIAVGTRVAFQDDVNGVTTILIKNQKNKIIATVNTKQIKSFVTNFSMEKIENIINLAIEVSREEYEKPVKFLPIEGVMK
ncbi:hypothetical protein [Clostridium tarantellae]|uniref:DUF4252 domain-containing protein n=1 Tax=Clostridium tarantellae TaxID=39493 RepID=A0A6I1MNH3_9CLOT|nr:hypothetical protein [Clostridium tarantellae]MPQ43657.1 hypothetical protein [Clostridium tarantellae]